MATSPSLRGSECQPRVLGDREAERALSVKMLMPPLNNKAALLRCKLLGLGQFADLEPLRLAQLYSPLNLEDGLAMLQPISQHASTR